MNILNLIVYIAVIAFFCQVFTALFYVLFVKDTVRELKQLLQLRKDMAEQKLLISKIAKKLDNRTEL